jgi:hypothetical protein
LRHSLRTGDVTKRLGDEADIVAAIFQAGFQIGRHLFGCPQMFRNIIARGFGFFHGGKDAKDSQEKPCPVFDIEQNISRVV